MGRGAYALARVAVAVRAAAGPLWWAGLLSAGAGTLVPGLTGRRIGVTAGAALFLIVAAVVFAVRRGRYGELARGASRAGRSVFLQDRAVTLRNGRRAARWWLALAFLAAVGSSFAVPAAAGLAMAGAGAGLWAKARWLGGLERRAESLLWVRVDSARRGPAGRDVRGYETTGLSAGDAAPGGARRRTRRTRPGVSAAR
ncbi:membrane protein [Streptomyces eurocidicus]|uniref:Membrane protein n=1 Tax=Streptomyces eurocidicus TaxID=66423 RepID=A0A2N8NT11_STREU|nr:hypothetical protein [Streptomyces eurocidicus]MBB5120152.1 hypothetical protein [Streptomyces eurocidicus]MBF6051117.1 hypothetical protein [Streptomyces eurocidicus]PNE31908.1 membrane protein [Streptomyces eurocidicus]